MKRLEIYVSGVVQGVGFRYFTKRVAKELGLKGYVMNLPDGRVYINVEGDEGRLEKFLSAIKEGPPMAIVKGVEVKEGKADGEFKDFTIRYG
jgi:acylphosphatase